MPGEVTMDPILARQGDLPSREDILVREPGDILARQDRPSRGDILVILAQVRAILVRLGDLRVDILDQQLQLLRLDILVTREQEARLRDLEDTLALPTGRFCCACSSAALAKPCSCSS